MARGPESSTTPFPELAEKYDHDHGEVATDIGSERGQSGAAVEGGGVQVDKKGGSSDRLGSTVASLSPEYLALRAKTRLEETRRREQEPSLSKQMDSHPSTARTPASTAGNKLVASRVLQEAVQREASSQGTLITSRDHMNSLQSKSNDDDGTNTDPGQWSDMTSPMGSAGNITPKNAVAYSSTMPQGAAPPLPPVAESASPREDSAGSDAYSRKERVISELISKIRSTSEQHGGLPTSLFCQDSLTFALLNRSCANRSLDCSNSDSGHEFVPEWLVS